MRHCVREPSRDRNQNHRGELRHSRHNSGAALKSRLFSDNDLGEITVKLAGETSGCSAARSQQWDSRSPLAAQASPDTHGATYRRNR